MRISGILRLQAWEDVNFWKIIQLITVVPYSGYTTLVARFNPAPVNLVATATLGFLVVMSVYQVVRYTVRPEMVYAKFFQMNPNMV